MLRLMRLGVAEQARLIRSREVSPAEMVEAARAAVEKSNPKLNAVVLQIYDIARQAVKDPKGDEPYATYRCC